MGHRAFLQPTIASLLLAVGLVLTTGMTLGCAVSNNADAPGMLPSVQTMDADLDDGGSATDAPPFRMQPQFQGSPLCNAVHWMGCYPDDPKSANAQECNLELDGGMYLGGGY